MQKLKIGDTVQVMRGDERKAGPASDGGKARSNRGKLLAIDREANRVRVEGVRVHKRHLSRGKRRPDQESGIVEVPGTIALPAVALVCPKCDKPTRVGIRKEDGKSKRFCKRCDAAIDG